MNFSNMWLRLFQINSGKMLTVYANDCLFNYYYKTIVLSLLLTIVFINFFKRNSINQKKY
jgi:hypothetical protein